MTEHEFDTALKKACRKAYGRRGSKKAKIQGAAEVHALTLGLGPDVYAFTGTRRVTFIEIETYKNTERKPENYDPCNP